MEISPTFLLSAAVALITLIAYLVQLKPRMDTNKSDIEKLQAEVTRHRENETIHFNKAQSGEINERYNERFATISREVVELKMQMNMSLKEINGKLDRLTEKK